MEFRSWFRIVYHLIKAPEKSDGCCRTMIWYVIVVWQATTIYAIYAICVPIAYWIIYFCIWTFHLIILHAICICQIVCWLPLCVCVCALALNIIEMFFDWTVANQCCLCVCVCVVVVRVCVKLRARMPSTIFRCGKMISKGIWFS